MTAAPTEHDRPAVAGISTDDDKSSNNVVAFPMLPGKQALVAVLQRLKPTSYQKTKRDQIGWLLTAAHSERYPDHILRQVADILAGQVKRKECPGPVQLRQLYDSEVARHQQQQRAAQQRTKSPPPSADDDDDADFDMMIDVAMRYRELWSAWEWKFLRSVKYYRRLSERQIDVIEALYDRALAERVK